MKITSYVSNLLVLFSPDEANDKRRADRRLICRLRRDVVLLVHGHVRFGSALFGRRCRRRR